MTNFIIVHLYPDLMNLYGDRGNLICLQKRLEWYGHRCTIKPVHLGDRLDYNWVDMVFMGGGSDREQGLVYQDLITRGDRLREQIEQGLPMLCICGAYQLLGQAYVAQDGSRMSGLGFFDFTTQSEKGRLIGNVVIEAELMGVSGTVVGFENHGGRTYFDDDSLKPFGRVIKGYGNNGKDRQEGLHYMNLVGTYLHGPLLPKNPAVADYFIKCMAGRRGVELTGSLDNSIENFTHEQVKKKVLSS